MCQGLDDEELLDLAFDSQSSIQTFVRKKAIG
jgi:hypothetical protein